MKIWGAVILLTIAIGFSLYGEDQAAITASEKRAIAMYPDSAIEGSALNTAIKNEMASLESKNPKFFEDPDYPLMLAAKCAAKLGIASKSASQEQHQEIQLVTADHIKAYWLKNLPKTPGSLDANYHQIRKQNAKFERQLENGELDEEAQDKANLVNIEILTKAGRFEQANLLQTKRTAYQQKIAREKSDYEQDKAISLLQREQTRSLNSLRSQQSQIMQEMNIHKSQMDQQRRDLQFQLEEQRNRINSMKRDPNVIYTY